MEIIETKIPDVKIVVPKVFGDERGYFMETYRESWLDNLGVSKPFVQDNQSKSSHGILRGLHYQVNNPQGKLVRVVSGTVFDVAVDLRKTSKTFGKWVGVELSAENKKQLWVPEGFAHGFYVMSEEAEFVYKCTDYYSPENDRCLLWNDESINVEWPISPENKPLLSSKDINGLKFMDAETYE